MQRDTFVPLPEVNGSSEIIQSEIKVPPWFEPEKIGMNVAGLEAVCRRRAQIRRLLLRTVDGGSELKVFRGFDFEQISSEVEDFYFLPGLPQWRVRKPKWQNPRLREHELVSAEALLGMDNIKHRILRHQELRSPQILVAAFDREVKNLLSFCTPQLYPLFRGLALTVAVNRIDIFRALE